MNHLWNLIRKELKELLTPASVISILVVALIFGSMGGLLGSETEKASELPVIGVYNSDAGVTIGSDEVNYGDLAFGYIEDFYGTAADRIVTITGSYTQGNITEAMDEFGVNILLFFNTNYSTNIDNGNRGTIYVYWNDVSTGMFGTVSTAMVYALIDHVSSETAKEITGMDDEDMFPVAMSNQTLFNGTVYDNLTPADISNALQSQSFLMPILIMIIITMIGSMIISSMGNEKENKTLETLLTLPVKRTTIVSGKLMGSAIAGMIFGVVYLIGMYFYTSSVWSAGSLSLNDLGLTLTLVDWGIVAAVIFLAIMSALGICMILGAFVKNYKAAQTLTLPISVLAMIPMLVTMFTDFGSLPALLQVLIFAIPFSHPMMIMNNLMLGNTLMVWSGLAYLAVFALVMIYITVRIYNSDILLTGLMKKKGKKGLFSAMKRTKG